MADKTSHLLPGLSTPTAEQLQSSFYRFALLFSLNHGCVTTPLAYSTALLGDVAYAGNSVLYVSTMLCTLFAGTGVHAALGPQRSATLGFALYSLYVGSFAVTCALETGSAAAWAVFVGGSAVGGLAAAIIWTAQGAIFANTAQAVAASKGIATSEATNALGAAFAWRFLAGEVACKALGTVLKLCFPPSAGVKEVWMAVFLPYFAAAAASAVLVARVPHIDAPRPESTSSRCEKLMGAVSLWSDPRLWLLSLTNLTFGFTAAFMNGYVNQKDVASNPALSATVIGFLTALTAAVAGAAAPLFAGITQRFGKGYSVALGSLCFLCIPLSQLAGNPSEWGWGVLVLFVLQGMGRSMYESTNKVVFADAFPGTAPAAFANCMMQCSLAFAVCFFLSALFNDEPVVLAAIASTLALVTVPCYLLASKM